MLAMAARTETHTQQGHALAKGARLELGALGGQLRGQRVGQDLAFRKEDVERNERHPPVGARESGQSWRL